MLEVSQIQRAAQHPLPQPKGRPAKVFIVDDHDLLRLGLRLALEERAPGCVEWLEAATLSDAVEIYGSQLEPVDLVLLDLNLADCKGLQGLRRFLSAFPQARVAIYSGTQDEFIMRQAHTLGSVGYLPKGEGAAVTCETILSLLTSVPMHKNCIASRRRGVPHTDELGPRHHEILELVLEGCSNQEISAATKLSLGTVKNYVSAILLAVDVKSRSHLISLFR